MLIPSSHPQVFVTECQRNGVNVCVTDTQHSGYSAEAIDSKARQHESWNRPRLKSQETIETALMMADRF
ncbi:MAG: hypothetical protein WAV20_14445, partial [Blastocatellia bacterium]